MINLKKILFFVSAFSFISSFETLLSFKDGDLVTIKSADNRYLVMPLSPTQGTKYQALFLATLTHPNRIFKIKKFGDQVAFLGTTNGYYSGTSVGMLNTATSWKYAAFFDMNKTDNPTDYNKFDLTHKGGDNYTIKNMWGLYEKPSGNFLKNAGEEYTFEIKKIIGDGDFVSIKNSAGQYMEILPDANPTGPANQRGLKFDSTTLSKISQSFKIKLSGDNIGFIGSVNGDYSTRGYSGCLDAYYSGKNAYFYQNTQQANWNVTGHRAFKIYPKGEGQFAILSEQHRVFEKSINNELVESSKDLTQFNTLAGPEIFTIEKVVPFKDGDFVTIKDNTGKYLEATSEATGAAGHYGAKFLSTTLSKASQKFEVRTSGDYVGFIGSTTGNYTGNDAGLLDAYNRNNYAYFYRGSYDVGSYRAFLPYIKGANKFALLSGQHQVFEQSANGKLLETNTNLSNIASLSNAGVFEITKVDKPSSTQELGEDVTKLQAQVTSLNNLVTTKDATIKTLNSQITTKDATIKTLNSNISTKDATIKTLNDQLAAAPSGTEITRLNNLINDPNTGYLKQIKDLTSQSGDAGTQITGLSNLINDPNTGLKAKLETQNADIKELQDQITTLRTTVSTSTARKPPTRRTYQRRGYQTGRRGRTIR